MKAAVIVAVLALAAVCAAESLRKETSAPLSDDDCCLNGRSNVFGILACISTVGLDRRLLPERRRLV
jgi:hypothetical protein